MMPLPHGGGIEEAARAWGCDVRDILDLSTGLHPAGAPAWLGDWMRRHALLAGYYPDIDGEPARSALAADFGVGPDCVLIASGAQAVIEIVFQAMGWKSVAVRVPCYSEPLRCARRSGCEVRGFESGEPPVADALWLTSPHNPDGASQPFPDGYSGVLDESYMPFAERRGIGLKAGVLRLGSLTKTFCIPGLRLGYVIADETVIRKLRAWLPPWPAPTMALHLLPDLLPEADGRDAQARAARQRLGELLGAHGWHVRASAASFVLAGACAAMPDFPAHRILVRAFPEWPQLAGCLRFGLPGDEAGWRRLEEALCP